MAQSDLLPSGEERGRLAARRTLTIALVALFIGIPVAVALGVLATALF